MIKKPERIISTAFFAAALAFVLFSWLSRQHNGPAEGPDKTVAEVVSPTTAPNTGHGAPAQPATPPDIHQRPQDRADTIDLTAGQVVATVNGVSILGRDLVAFSSDDPAAKQTITRASYKFALDHAMDRELVFQAADNQGLDLTDAQWKQLDQLRGAARAASRTPANASADPPEVEFQLRESASSILLSALLAKAGLTPPVATDAQVQQYYQAHAADFGQLPNNPESQAAAWQKISAQVRDYLDLSRRAAYHQQIRTFLDQLRSTARTSVLSPSGDT